MADNKFMKRRFFLQQASQLAIALGVGGVGFRSGGRLLAYDQALAQSTPRKLALLIGINQYPQHPLAGCLTDVERQRELLLYRFGFQPADIITLTDHQATQQNVIEAFISHLIGQAKANDVVVVHFSGCGQRWLWGDPQKAVENCLVLADPQGGQLTDQTLRLLLLALPSSQVTTILDTSYVIPSESTIEGISCSGHLRSRSLPTQVLSEFPPQELALRESLLTRLPSWQKLKRLRQDLTGLIPGSVIAAAYPTLTQASSLEHPLEQQLGTQAYENQWSGFSAGLLTYALTQSLWSAPSTTSLQISFSRAAGMIEQGVGASQQPQLSFKKMPESPLLAYYLRPQSILGAEGAIAGLEEDGRTVELHLGGLPPLVLEDYGINSLFTVETPTPNLGLMLQVTKRDGFAVKAKWRRREETGEIPALQVGQVVREAVRVIPKNMAIAVAIAANLERIERVDATSAFSSIPNVNTVVAGESSQPTDCTFTKLSEQSTPQGGYGLLTPSCHLIPNTLGEKGEAVKTAVRRLLPCFQTLRAVKLLRLTDNHASSQLRVRADLEQVAPEARILMQRAAMRAEFSDRVLPTLTSEALSLAIGSRIRYQLYNDEETPVYFLLLGLNLPGSTLSIAQPTHVSVSPVLSANSSSEGSVASKNGVLQAIPPKTTLMIPQAATAIEWAVGGPKGFAETQVIFSKTPFTQTLEVLKLVKTSNVSNNPTAGVVANPLEVAQAVLQDLHQGSYSASDWAAIAAQGTESYALDVKTWATLRFVYQVA